MICVDFLTGKGSPRAIERFKIYQNVTDVSFREKIGMQEINGMGTRQRDYHQIFF